jgi:hypothetical protein
MAALGTMVRATRDCSAIWLRKLNVEFNQRDSVRKLNVEFNQRHSVRKLNVEFNQRGRGYTELGVQSWREEFNGCNGDVSGTTASCTENVL